MDDTSLVLGLTQYWLKGGYKRVRWWVVASFISSDLITGDNYRRYPGSESDPVKDSGVGSATMRRVLVSVCALFATCVTSVASDPHVDPPWGVPLFLTPLIKAGKTLEAKTQSKTPSLKRNVTSYSGFLTVDEKLGSNLFFWYFSAERAPNAAPVILWLQGGPGTSGLNGVFTENGPFYVKLHRGLKMKKFYWPQIAHVIYIDSPVGTGFSFTKQTAGYSRNLNQVVDNLYEALLQFFTVFSELYKNELYIVGETYGGQYAVALAYKIHREAPSSLLKMNLKGIAIQNGLCDPVNMMKYSEFLYQVGLVDVKGQIALEKQEDRITALISQRKYLESFRGFDSTIYGALFSRKTLFRTLTSFDVNVNFLHSKEDVPYGDYEKYLDKDIVRKALHVGNLTFHGDFSVGLYLAGDIMKSVKTTLEILLESYKVLVYTGQMNMVVTVPGVENFLAKLKWSGAGEFGRAPRQIWRVEQNIAGYSKTAKGLTALVVRNAGHKIALDQPKWGIDLIQRFVKGKPFHEL